MTGEDSIYQKGRILNRGSTTNGDRNSGRGEGKTKYSVGEGQTKLLASDVSDEHQHKKEQEPFVLGLQQGFSSPTFTASACKLQRPYTY